VQVIRFSAHQIEALERDDYASLPGATSVRGLVRNYARFLKLDAAPLLTQLDPAVPVTEADVRPPVNMGGAEQPTIGQAGTVQVVAVAVAILLLAMGAYWLATLPADNGLAGLWRGVAGGPAAPAPAGAAAPAAVPVVQPAPAVVAESPPPAAGEATGVPPQPGLRVEFDDRSWIEVRDATQKVVFVGEYPAARCRTSKARRPSSSGSAGHRRFASSWASAASISSRIPAKISPGSAWNERNARGASAARRPSRRVMVGKVGVGGTAPAAPVVVQSMTNTDTEDVFATAMQVAQLARAGSELVRITVNTRAAAAAVPKIRERWRR
jgi:hypothetical protein